MLYTKRITRVVWRFGDGSPAFLLSCGVVVVRMVVGFVGEKGPFVSRKTCMGSRYEEHTGDALEPMAEEGRGKLRKAAVRCKRPNDPLMSEWGNLPGVMLGRPYEVGDPVK